MSFLDQKTLSNYQIILHYPFFSNLIKLQKQTKTNLKNIVFYYIFSHFNRGGYFTFICKLPDQICDGCDPLTHNSKKSLHFTSLHILHSLILNITKFKQITKYNQTNLIIYFDTHFDKY